MQTKLFKLEMGAFLLLRGPGTLSLVLVTAAPFLSLGKGRKPHKWDLPYKLNILSQMFPKSACESSGNKSFFFGLLFQNAYPRPLVCRTCRWLLSLNCHHVCSVVLSYTRLTPCLVKITKPLPCMMFSDMWPFKSRSKQFNYKAMVRSNLGASVEHSQKSFPWLTKNKTWVKSHQKKPLCMSCEETKRDRVTI